MSRDISIGVITYTLAIKSCEAYYNQFYIIYNISPILTKWSGRRGLNPQQPAWKAGTLPIELLPHMAPQTGLEPVTL